MKRIVNGKRYDTDIAEEMASWANMADRGNWRYATYTVYRTRRGGWFIHYCGGPLSHYSHQEGSEHWGDEGISPQTPEKAREHLERCGSDGMEAVEKYFAVEEA